MEIIVGKNAGFCYGVKRAVYGAKEILKENKNVCCLGEIVHNKQVVETLEKQGMRFIEDIKEVEDEVIIRAHGVKKEIYEYARVNKIKVRDYTCPFVLKIHEIAKKYMEKGYYIFLCGNSNHPENIGTISHCGTNYYVIEKEEEALKALEKFRKVNINKLLIISQTTFSLEKFYIIEEIIKNELPKNIEIAVYNTICSATEIRQKETRKIAKQVDYMIVVGGKNSSNTKKLYEIAKNRLPKYNMC